MRSAIIYLIAILIPSLLLAQEKENGFTQIFYPNGQVSSEGMMRDGKPDGYWKTYYTTGVIKSEGLRTNFLLDSTWTFYNQKGEVIQRINYNIGKRNGYSITYSYEQSSQGVEIARELYVNGIKEGRSYYYHPNGNLKEEVYYEEGKRQGPSRAFDSDGQLVALQEYHNDYLVERIRVNRTDNEGRKQGQWLEFYEDGTVKREVVYKDNQIDGIYKEFEPDGGLSLVMEYEEGRIVEEDEEEILAEQIEIRREFDDDGNVIFQGSYKDNVPVGIHRFFNAEGEVINAYIYNDLGVKVSEGVIDEQGNREGEWQDLYPNGKVRAKGLYRNNNKSGTWTHYYPNGQTEQVGNFLRGLPDGLWTWYYEDGSLLREESYFNGREDGRMIEYNELGEVITEGEYINGEKEGEWIYQVGDHVEKGKYQTGLRTGEWEYYYLDGTLHFEGEYVQGQPSGKHKYYYPNGELKEERYYEMGIRERNWKKYDQLGNLTMTITYRNNMEHRINGQRIDLPQGSVRIIK
jgi:antitoxin component YwqK of YwqJK toxin-antitoxin module